MSKFNLSKTLSAIYSTTPKSASPFFFTIDCQESFPQLDTPFPPSPLIANNPPTFKNPLINLLPATQNPNKLASLISSFLKQNNPQDDITIFPKEFHHLGAHHISEILLRSQSDPVSALSFFNWVKTHLPHTPSIQNYCHVVLILTWSHKLKPAMELLQEMISLGKDGNIDWFNTFVLCSKDCNWNPIVFDLLIKAHLKLGMVQDGYHLFKKTVATGFAPSIITCNFLLHGLLKTNHLNHCWNTYEGMKKLEIRSNTYTGNILINILSKNGDMENVFRFLEKMEEEEGFEPDIITYNTLISAYCRTGRVNDALKLYHIMYVRNMFPDLVTYISLVHGLCMDGRIEESHRLFGKMREEGISPDLVMFNTLIWGYSKEGKMQEAFSMLFEMIQNGITPDYITYFVIIERHREQNKLLKSLNLVSEMEKLNVHVPWEIYNHLVMCLCEEDRPTAAINLMARISEMGYRPNMRICKKLIESLTRKDYLAEALSLKEELVCKGIKLDIKTYQCLLNGLTRDGRMVEAESLVEEMVKNGVMPNGEICRALVNGYCQQGDIGKGVSVMEQFAMELCVHDREGYNVLMKTICDVGDMNMFVEQQDRLMKVGLVPNNLTCKNMVHKMWDMVKSKEKQSLE